ncbi:MAG: hypothetical protein Q7R40_12200 [Phaeospirillum sp.]|nr:hypothetical protein [Phaeospirillum sp.]
MTNLEQGKSCRTGLPLSVGIVNQATTNVLAELLIDAAPGGELRIRVVAIGPPWLSRRKGLLLLEGPRPEPEEMEQTR